MRAQNRLTEALQQKLSTANTAAEKEQIYIETLTQLSTIVIDETELNKIAVSIAEDPHAIDWPDGFDIETTLR